MNMLNEKAYLYLISIAQNSTDEKWDLDLSLQNQTFLANYENIAIFFSFILVNFVNMWIWAGHSQIKWMLSLWVTRPC